MVIGILRSVDEGYFGHVVSLGFGRVPIVVVPDGEKDFSFDVLSGNADDSMAIRFGTAVRRVSKDGNYLIFKLDCPALPGPIEATMSLKPSRQGIYALEWKRKPRPKR